MSAPFKVGDVVRYKTGDGRKHIISKVEVEDGLSTPFYVYRFEDGGCCVGSWDIELFPKKTLHLVLTHHWYDEIDLNGKREEYRANTEYYRKRLTYLKTPLLFSHRNGYQRIPYKEYTEVCFHRGYTSTTMTWYIDGIGFGKGRKEWGAPDESCHIIKISKRQ